MIRRRRELYALILLLMCGAAVTCLYGQPAGLNSTLVLRSQAVSIAEETYAKIDGMMRTSERVGIAVEGGTIRTIVENAFIDLFSRKGFEASLQGLQSRSKHLLEVTILEQGVRYSPIADGQYRREIHTAIEARRTSNDTSAVSYLGAFQREQVDTVAFREELGIVSETRESEKTIFDRLLGPVLLIGGTFLIVYLFFTVRN